MALPRPARLLLALLALVAPVLVVLGTATPSYAGSLCGSPLPPPLGNIGDCDAPVAEIYRHRTAESGGLEIPENGQTTARTAFFAARPANLADEPDPQGVTYRCRVEKDDTVFQDWTACTETPDPGTNNAAIATVSLDSLTPGTYRLSIRAKDTA